MKSDLTDPVQRPHKKVCIEHHLDLLRGELDHTYNRLFHDRTEVRSEPENKGLN